MTILEIFTMAVALGTDAFSVAMAVGVRKYCLKAIIKISCVIAIFHILMPLLGLYGGNLLQAFLRDILKLDGRINYIFSLIGSGLLMLIGFYMIIETWLDTEYEKCDIKLTGWGVLALALSVSMDAFSVGVSLGMLGEIKPVVVMSFGTTAGIMMASGLYLGSKIGKWLGDRAQIIGGMILIILAVHFLLS